MKNEKRITCVEKGLIIINAQKPTFSDCLSFQKMSVRFKGFSHHHNTSGRTKVSLF
jgi:hypothetical protein